MVRRTDLTGKVTATLDATGRWQSPNRGTIHTARESKAGHTRIWTRCPSLYEHACARSAAICVPSLITGSGQVGESAPRRPQSYAWVTR